VSGKIAVFVGYLKKDELKVKRGAGKS